MLCHWLSQRVRSNYSLIVALEKGQGVNKIVTEKIRSPSVSYKYTHHIFWHLAVKISCPFWKKMSILHLDVRYIRPHAQDRENVSGVHKCQYNMLSENIVGDAREGGSVVVAALMKAIRKTNESLLEQQQRAGRPFRKAAK